MSMAARAGRGEKRFETGHIGGEYRACCVVDRIDSISLIGPSFVVRRYLGHWSLNKSHHFDTPTAREDPRINLCDFYLFRGHPGTTVIALTMNPDAGMWAPEAFRDEETLCFPLRSG